MVCEIAKKSAWDYHVNMKFAEDQMLQLSMLLDQKLEPIKSDIKDLKKDTKFLKKEAKYLRDTANTLVEFFEEGDQKVLKRVELLEKHLHITHTA